jgi:hypothetical protein
LASEFNPTTEKRPSESIAETFLGYLKMKDDETASRPQNAIEVLQGKLRNVLTAQAKKRRNTSSERKNQPARETNFTCYKAHRSKPVT